MTPPPAEKPVLNLPTYPFILFGIPVLISLGVHFFWDFSPLPDTLAFAVGAPLMVIGTMLGMWSVWTMVSQGEHPEPGRGTHKIISNGPFRFSRNPSYLALVATSTGFALIINSLTVLIGIPFGFAILALWVVPAEERYLAALLKDDYEAYRNRVRRWL
jgi:protein-S-isoprenylcysteine O-methyltransferase Ste14